jgi:hypothetical protein
VKLPCRKKGYEDQPEYYQWLLGPLFLSIRKGVKRMNEAELRAAVERKKGSSTYDIWYIGITDDCARRKGEHEGEGKSCTYWSDWKADSEAIARSVEAFFLDKGMKGGTGGGTHPTFVYMF